MSCAMICVAPLTGRAVAPEVSVIVEPDGASSGTLWQAMHAAPVSRPTPRRGKRKRVNMRTLTILISRKLQGQAHMQPSIREQPGSREQGYAMAALLVGMSIAAIMLTLAMPVWKQMTQREREQELIFRGMQYAHAIGMFQRKYANAYPPNIDVLVNEHFRRKKFKDPITNDDFVPVMAAGGGAGIGIGTGGASAQPGQIATPGGGATRGRGAAPPPPQPGTIGAPAPGGVGGGIMGVTSKSSDKSIRVYNGRNHYNEWQFVYLPPVAAPGAGGAPGSPVPGQRGGQPGQRGGFGNQPGQGGFGSQPGQGGFGGSRGAGTGRPGPAGTPPATGT